MTHGSFQRSFFYDWLRVICLRTERKITKACVGLWFVFHAVFLGMYIRFDSCQFDSNILMFFIVASVGSVFK